jgi:hypothetical protein
MLLFIPTFFIVALYGGMLAKEFVHDLFILQKRPARLVLDRESCTPFVR